MAARMWMCLHVLSVIHGASFCIMWGQHYNWGCSFLITELVRIFPDLRDSLSCYISILLDYWIQFIPKYFSWSTSLIVSYRLYPGLQSALFFNIYFFLQPELCIYRHAPPILWFSIHGFSNSRFTTASQKIGKLKEWMVCKFQNARQSRAGHNVMKSSSPNKPSTWLNFICPHTLPCRTCLYSASSIVAVHISCCVISVFVFRKPLFIS
jgi:hypothetical protein